MSHVYISACMSVLCLSVCSVCLSVCLYVCVFVCVSEKGAEIQATLAEMTGQKTVPNVFISGQHIGKLSMSVHMSLYVSVCLSLSTRVRTIPVLGYWVLGDICIYWVISVSGDIFLAVTPDAI